MADTTDIDTIYDLIQNEFDYLDKRVGNRRKRLMAITELPQLARDLYLVHDIVAITSNSGTRAWIAYHHDETGWIDCAIEAFRHIGHPQISDGIKRCLSVFLSKRDSMTSKDDEIPSHYIIDQADNIVRSLHAYLLAHGYVWLLANPDS
jgi:hypothetical protein